MITPDDTTRSLTLPLTFGAVVAAGAATAGTDVERAAVGAPGVPLVAEVAPLPASAPNIASTMNRPKQPIMPFCQKGIGLAGTTAGGIEATAGGGADSDAL